MPIKAPTHQANPSASRGEYRSTAAARGYGSRWQRAREVFLHEHPLCVECEGKGITAPASVVDHIIPHRGDNKLFWRTSNWQALCRACHGAKTARGA